MEELKAAMIELRRNVKYLTRQETRTIKGQILAGDITGAMRGLDRLLRKRGV